MYFFALKRDMLFLLHGLRIIKSYYSGPLHQHLSGIFAGCKIMSPYILEHIQTQHFRLTLTKYP